MPRIIDNPPRELIKKWGELAYVSDGERQRILNLPFGEFKPERERLKKEIKEAKKNKKVDDYASVHRRPQS